MSMGKKKKKKNQLSSGFKEVIALSSPYSSP